jgi:hypothetical protein
MQLPLAGGFDYYHSLTITITHDVIASDASLGIARRKASKGNMLREASAK